MSTNQRPKSLEQIIEALRTEVVRLSPDIIFEIDTSPAGEAALSVDSYSYTLTGRGTFVGLTNVDFRAFFNAKGEPNYFRARVPSSASPGTLNIDALMAGSDWTQLLVPDIFRNAFILSSWTAEFNTDKHRPSKLSLEFRVAGQFTPVSDFALAMKEIAVGYEIEHPLAPRSNPVEPEYARKISGLLTATLTLLGTEAKLTSNLVTTWAEWKLSTDSYEVDKALPEVWKLLHADDVLPWPGFMDDFSLSKLQVDFYPAGRLDLTLWTSPLGNAHVIVKRSSGGRPAALSTQLSGEYAGTAAPRGSSVLETLFAMSLPENPDFPGPLATLNSFRAVDAALVISTFRDPVETTLPIFAGLGTGKTRVTRGVTFLAIVDIDNLRDHQLRQLFERVCRYLAVESPLDALLFRGNLPLPPDPLQNFSASVSLTFTQDLSYFDRVFIRNISLEAKPAAADPEFTLYATVAVVLNDPDAPLVFRTGLTLQPATLTVAGRGQMEGVLTLPRPFGFPKVSLANLSLTMGIKFSTEIPTPDNLFLSGEILVNDLVGNATIGLDQNEFGKNMILARFCNLDFASVIDAFCGPDISRRVPAHLYRMLGDSGITAAYLKLIPPGAAPAFIGGVPPPDPGFKDHCHPLPAVPDNDFTPGYSLAGEGRILNWDGLFVFSFEGDMSGLSAGLTAIGRMDPLPSSSPPQLPGGMTLFQISGSGGRGRPELFVDLSTRHVIGGISDGSATAEAGPSTSTGYSEDQIIYCNGRITILGATADTSLNLTSAGFQGTLTGDILGFLRGTIQATIVDFRSALAGTSVSGYVDQAVVRAVQGRATDVVKRVLGSRLTNVLGYVSSSLLDVRSITFSGSLESFRTRLAVEVDYVAGGAADTVVVPIEERSIDAFAEHVGREIAGRSNAAFETLITDAERVLAAVQAAAALADASNKALAEMKARAGEALHVARRADEAAIQAAGEVRRRLANAAHAVGTPARQFQSVANKVSDTLREFGEFTEALATKLFNTPVNALTNAWDDFEKELKRALTSSDNEELVMKNGPAFRILTKAGGGVLTASPVTRKNYPVSVGPAGSGIAQAWQLVPNDKINEGSFFLVSAYNGLLIAKPRATHLLLIPHESDHKDRERMLMEPVPNESGWYFLKYRDTYVRDRVRYQTYAELRSIVFNDDDALKKNPGFQLGVPRWVLAPVAYPVGGRPGDPAKFRFEKAGDIDWRMSKKLPPFMNAAAAWVEGRRYGIAGEPEQFMYAGETFRWIPDVETLAAGGWERQPLVTLPFNERIGMVLGPPLPTRRDGALLQAHGEPEVFIMDQGRRRWVPDPATFEILGLHAEQIQFVIKADLDAIPTGEPVPSLIPKVELHERVLYQVPGDVTVFVVIGRMPRAIPDAETLLAMGYDWSMIVRVSAQDLNALPRGATLPSRKDGALVRADGHPEVYVMEKAVRRHIPDPETFVARGLDWGKIQVVAVADLADIPVGPAVPSQRALQGPGANASSPGMTT